MFLVFGILLILLKNKTMSKQIGPLETKKWMIIICIVMLILACVSGGFVLAGGNFLTVGTGFLYRLC